ncbi:isochorismate synthase, partial [Vibrio alginolyticus]
MSQFHQAVKRIIERVQQSEGNQTRLVEPLSEKPNFSFIDWLDAQPLFPKFYW